MKYQVMIEEAFCKTFEVDANSPEEAEKLILEEYESNASLIPHNLPASKQIAVSCEETGYAEGWRILEDPGTTSVFSRK